SPTACSRLVIPEGLAPSGCSVRRKSCCTDIQSAMTPEIHTSSGTAPQTVASPALPEPLRTWSGTNTDYPREKTVAAIFEEIAEAHADAIAVNLADSRLTYAELNARANLLAHRLRQLGVGPESIVGCCMKRSIELIVSLVAVLKAGGAYVPLDPAYPKERFD